MISPNAREALRQMVVRAIHASPLVVGAGLRTVEAGPELSKGHADQAVVLTVSSYLFRLTLLIHFRDDRVSRTHFATVNRVQAAEMDAQGFSDAIRECGNICCGNLNRDLARVFPHVGMSTPNLIDHRCVAYLGKLGADYVQHFELLDANGPPFAVTVCVKAFAALDFTAELAAEEPTGELEMF